MNKARLLVCAALLAASAQGCGWFDTRPYADDQNAGAGARGGEGTVSVGGRAEDSGEPAEPEAGEGGSAGTASGNGGASGIGGIGGLGGLGGRSGMDAAGTSGGAAGDASMPIVCDAACFAEPLLEAFVGHPEPRRFAVTDESTASGDQARAWLLARDPDGSHRLLSLRLPDKEDEEPAPWIDTGIDDVASNPVGLSFADEDVQQQRVFFTRYGRLQMLTPFSSNVEGDIDGDEVVGEEDLDGGVPSAGFYLEELPLFDDDIRLEEGDLAAITFFVEDERRIAVLAPATHHGVPGGYCLFESSSSGWTASCEDEPIMHAETDVEGVVVDSEAHFYFRSAANGLIRLARTPFDGYVRSDVAVPHGRPLAPSFTATVSEIEGRVQLIAITYDGEIWSARPLATQRTAPAWAQLPPLTLGVRASTRPAVIAAVLTDNNAPVLQEAAEVYRLTELRVIGDDGRMYHLVTTKELEELPWASSWYQVEDIGRDHYALALGAITQHKLEFIYTYHLANALTVTGSEQATTLQETPKYFNFIFWRDRLRFQRPAALPSPAPLAELSAAAGGDAVLIAGAQRGPEPPFNVALVSSRDGATTYESVVLASPGESEPTMSLLQPTLRYAGGAFHLTTLERALPADCKEQPAELRGITYRSAADAASLQALQPGDDGHYTLRSGNEYIDNPAFALTEGGGRVTAHIVFNAGATRDLLYLRFDPRKPHSWTETWLSDATHRVPAGPPVIATGNEGALYVATADSYRFEVCQVPSTGAVPASSCSDLTSFAMLDASEIYFGPPRAEVYGACAGNAAPYFACLRDERPFAMAVDTSALSPVDHRVVIAYSALDGPGSAIYVVSSRGGATIGGAPDTTEDDWLYLQRVSEPTTGAPRRYFDPELTIDSRRRVTITYSSLDVPPHAGQEARAFVAHGELGADGSFLAFTQREVGSWKPEELPLDCVTGRAALGAYRHPETVGARALHAVREGSGHDTRWLSKHARP